MSQGKNNGERCAFGLGHKKCRKFAMAALLSFFAAQTIASGADYAPTPLTPTLNTLHEQETAPIGSAYVLEERETQEATGEGNTVYNIPTFDLEKGTVTDKYFELIPDLTNPNKHSKFSFSEPYTNQTLTWHYIRNTLQSTTGNVIGMGVYNNAVYKTVDDDRILVPADLNDIYGDFLENSARTIHATTDSTTGYFSHGGGLDNHGTMQNVIGDFIGNQIYSEDYSGPIGIDGGGLRNGKTIGTITGNFIGNKADAGEGLDAFGGGIANHKSANDTTTTNGVSIGKVNATLISNEAKTGGGGVYNDNAEIGELNALLLNNKADHGAGIYNTTRANIEDANIIVVANKASTDGGGIYNTDRATMTVKGDFIANEAGRNGGAIYNDSTTADQVNMTVSGNFLNNKAGTNGGAIYSASDINLLADGEKYIIRGNTAGGQSEAVYMKGQPLVQHQEPVVDPVSGDPVIDPVTGQPQTQTVTDQPQIVPSLNLKTDNGGEWEIHDKINGTAGLYNVNMTGGGTVSLFNDITGGNVNLQDSTRLNTINNDIHVYEFNKFDVTGNSDMTVDFDIANEKMDRIVTNNNYGNLNGTLNVNGMNFLNDTNKYKASVLFAEPDLAPKVRNFGGDVGSTHNITTPVRMYDIQYNIHSDDNRGYFEFTSDWNPSILAAPVVLQAGAQSAMNTTMLYAFNHLDTYTKIPKFDRLTMQKQNQYAFASTDFNENLRNYNLRENRTSNNGVWLRPYAAFESIPLKNGPKVDSITYGTFLGYDSDFRAHRNGWHSVWSVYGGYQGGQLDFKGVSANLNGGVLGITDTFYKGNFWTAVTASAGAMIGDISTMYGHEDSTSIFGGIASKTGYNFEFKDGKYILQPIFRASYTFANTLDYRNAAGVKIDADPLHTVQIYPSLRFIANLKNGWQPYARVGMVWNLLNETDVSAGGYNLPEMHIKPYVEYGLGIQKLYKHRFTGFGQAMVRNGGRNGVAITLGFRYALGREADEEDKGLTFWEKVKAFFTS